MERRKKIIISRTDKIGDLILSIPSFYMVRKMYPDSEIIILVKTYSYDIVKNIPYVDRIIKIEDYTRKELLEKIAYFKADTFISLYDDEFISQLALNSKAKVRIGPRSKLKSFFVYNKGVIQKRSKSIKNEAEYNLDLIKRMDKKLFEEKYEINTSIYLEEKNREVADKYYKQNKIFGKTLIVNPFTGGSAKNITDIQYIELLKKILFVMPSLTIILITHISQEERVEKMLTEIGRKRVYTFSNGGDLLNTAAIIEKGNLYLGASTGPTHIAGSLKKLIVGIYPVKKTQSITRWGVFGTKTASYIVVDENNLKENYKNKNFECYDAKIEKKLIKLIKEKLNEVIS